MNRHPLETHSLASFFENVFRPIQLKDADSNYRTSFRTAIRWTAISLQREPTVGDLNDKTERHLRETLSKRGLSKVTWEIYSQRLRAIRRFACSLGLATAITPHWYRESILMRATVGSRAGTVATFFENHYRQRLNAASASQYQATVKLFSRCFGKDVLIEELSPSLVEQFLTWLRAKDLSLCTLRKHRERALAIWRLAYWLGLSFTCPPACFSAERTRN